MSSLDNHSLVVRYNLISSSYSPLWEEWKGYKHNGLAKAEIDFIDTLRSRNKGSELNIQKTTRDQLAPLIKAVNKLEQNYAHYQEWMIMKFMFIVIKQLGFTHLELFLSTPIENLQIESNLREILKLFGFDTLKELFDLYTEEDFKTASVFGLILRYIKVYKQNEGLRVRQQQLPV